MGREPDIERVRAIVNRDPTGYFMTRYEDAWMRLARYCDLYDKKGLDALTAEIDVNTTDQGIHVNAVIQQAVRLIVVMAKQQGTPASIICSRIATSKTGDGRSKLILPSFH